MSDNIEVLNTLGRDELKEKFFKCCSSHQWVDQLLNFRPFDNLSNLKILAENIWFDLTEKDWLEAFDGHPKIGDVESLKEKYNKSKSWSENEQAGVNQASEQTIQELSKLNEQYLNQNGFIFIVCATGKSAEEMLELLKQRIGNSRDQELKIAAIEQDKITKLRLEKLL